MFDSVSPSTSRHNRTRTISGGTLPRSRTLNRPAVSSAHFEAPSPAEAEEPATQGDKPHMLRSPTAPTIKLSPVDDVKKTDASLTKSFITSKLYEEEDELTNGGKQEGAPSDVSSLVSIFSSPPRRSGNLRPRSMIVGDFRSPASPPIAEKNEASPSPSPPKSQTPPSESPPAEKKPTMNGVSAAAPQEIGTADNEKQADVLSLVSRFSTSPRPSSQPTTPRAVSPTLSNDEITAPSPVISVTTTPPPQATVSEEPRVQPESKRSPTTSSLVTVRSQSTSPQDLTKRRSTGELYV